MRGAFHEMHSKIDVDQEWLGRWRNYFLSYYDEARVDDLLADLLDVLSPEEMQKLKDWQKKTTKRMQKPPAPPGM